jgi:hypothetical protein
MRYTKYDVAHRSVVSLLSVFIRDNYKYSVISVKLLSVLDCIFNKMETKLEFYNLFEKLLSEKREDNSSYSSNEKYLNIINELKGDNKSRRLNKFEIIIINIRGEEKLIAPIEKGSTNILYYVKNYELYHILNEIHLNIGHSDIVVNIK